MNPYHSRFPLRPASREEAGLFYSDDQADRALGTVGHVRMDFGSNGRGFYHTWWPHNGDRFNTSEFKEALQQFVDAMRADGPLKDLPSMDKFCRQNGGAITEDGRSYGYLAEVGNYRFCLRCTPSPGEYQCYLYCYDLRRQTLDRPVGRVTFANGEHMEFTDPRDYLRTIREERWTIWPMTCMGRRTPGRWRITSPAMARRQEGSRCDHTEQTAGAALCPEQRGTPGVRPGNCPLPYPRPGV